MLGVAVQPSQTASQTDEVGSLMLCDTETEPSEFNQLLSKNHDIYSFNMLVVRMQVWLDRVDQRHPRTGAKLRRRSENTPNTTILWN